ncbi:hypothetical protein MKZ38_004461 [Zalerion maritima]|uniref:Uncharacterized protein n=1 Tax=Zalerion maritima TaxID=339359 RepID=A0AAD5S4D8_9PEZI|nr:hypothetical protein MKZ38_004461 [Zalerion maritima]
MDEASKTTQTPQLPQSKTVDERPEPVSTATPTRKRQIVGDSDDDAEPRTKRARTTRPTSEPARLTRQNLARFNKMGKKKTSDPSDDSGSTKTLSTTASGFDVRARKNGVLDPMGSRPPKNLEEIRERLAAPRGTASPPESVYEDYAYTVKRAVNEATMVGETLPLLKTYPREPYTRVLNQAFTAFPKDMGFNNGLSAPQPDFIEGLEMEEFRPFPVDEYVQGAVLYKDDRRSVTLPHLAGEWKGPDGSMAEATLQSSYDGAALAFARNQALAYQGEFDHPGHASITTFTTNGTQVHFYAYYATPIEDGTLEYHQFPIKSTSLVNSHGEHKEGRRGLRNAQDHARKQSYALKDQLKEHYKQRSSGLHPIAEGVPTLPVPGTEPLHAYDNEDDYEVVEHQPVYQPMPPTSSKHKSSTTHSHHSHHSHSTPHSSKAPLSTHSSTHGSGQKRKAPSSQGSSSGSSYHSKYKSYWKKDAITGRYYHKHSDGTVSWLDDAEEGERD